MTTVTLRAVIRGQDVTREHILGWESVRLPRAARRIGLPVPAGPLAVQRQEFAAAKVALGAAEIRRRLARPLRLAEFTGRASAALSGGRRRASTCDLYVTGGDAASFARWFSDDTRGDYARSMLAANPDHFLIATTPDGRQEVIETTGGSPLPARFLIDYRDLSSLRTPLDPAYPVDASGVARAGNGVAIGGVRHQFRDVDGGFHAHLLVEFPARMPARMIRQHEWHLAAEFANWIESAFADAATAA